MRVPGPYARSSPYGFLLGGDVAGDWSCMRIIWLSQTGEILLDTQVSDMNANLGAHILNAQQLLICGFAKPSSTPYLFRLYTIAEPGKVQTQDYLLQPQSGSKYVIGPSGSEHLQWYDIEPDKTGLYVLDVEAWTVRRIELPAPPPLDPATIGVEIEAAEQANGPWQVIEAVPVPADKPQEFFRLKASKATVE